jgi:uncharacterized RDD family membrane protein YckC
MNTIKITTTQNIELEYDLSSLGERIVGYLIDLAILLAYGFILIIILESMSGFVYLSNHGWLYFLIYFPVCFYDLACEVFMNGQSVGKRVMKIRVVSIDGGQPTLGQYLIRWLFRLVDITITFYMCAIISIAVSERKQRLGDLIAGTAVIKTTPRTTFQQTIYTPVQQVNYQVTFPEVANLKDLDMQLVKEVIIVYSSWGNHLIVEKAAEKIMETLKIQSNMEPIKFLRVLLSDYNYLTSV